MVELRDLLLGSFLRELDSRLDHDRNRTQLVASNFDDLPFSDDQFYRYVLQLALRVCVPYWISCCWEECVWDVGVSILLGVIANNSYARATGDDADDV